MMPRFLPVNIADVDAMSIHGDIPGLVRVLKTGDISLQSAAITALARTGPDALPELIASLGSRNRHAVLGAIAAIAEIRDPRAIDPLIGKLKDTSSEIRWQAAVAIGEIGTQDHHEGIPTLQRMLSDPDKYVRLGAARSLEKLGWNPENDTDRAFFLLAVNDWPGLKNLGKPAVPVLTRFLRDSDPEVRIAAVRALGEIGDAGAGPALIRSLGDEDRKVRWEAMLASQQCGVSAHCLPRGLRSRPLLKKNPLIAGFLNFLLPGLGYGYLGKWWGIMIFQIDITLTVWLFKSKGESTTYLILFPFYIILAVHAWYAAGKIPEELP